MCFVKIGDQGNNRSALKMVKKTHILPELKFNGRDIDFCPWRLAVISAFCLLPSAFIELPLPPANRRGQ